MHRVAVLTLVLSSLLVGCSPHQNSGDTVRSAYDNHADTIESQAAAQPTMAGKKIYQARADAIREEGQDRETGLDGGTPSSGPMAGSSR